MKIGEQWSVCSISSKVNAVLYFDEESTEQNSENCLRLRVKSKSQAVIMAEDAEKNQTLIDLVNFAFGPCAQRHVIYSKVIFVGETKSSIGKLNNHYKNPNSTRFELPTDQLEDEIKQIQQSKGNVIVEGKYVSPPRAIHQLNIITDIKQLKEGIVGPLLFCWNVPTMKEAMQYFRNNKIIMFTKNKENNDAFECAAKNNCSIEINGLITAVDFIYGDAAIKLYTNSVAVTQMQGRINTEN